MRTIPAAKGRNRGFTMVEILMTITVLAILAAIAIPSFSGMLGRNRVKAAAEAIYQDLAFARTEGIKRNQFVRLTFSATGTWSYGMRSGDAETDAALDCDPSGTTCTIDGVTKVKSGSMLPSTSITLTNGSKLTFNPKRGTASPTDYAITVTHTSDTTAWVRVRVNALGRVVICSDQDKMGYPSC